jgi:HlyD family secretion protein
VQVVTVMAKLKKWIPWLLVVLVLVGAGYGIWRWRASTKQPDIVYKGSPVEKRRITGKVTASGTLSALVTVQVGAQVSGRIQVLNATFNSTVKKGELIAKIDPQLFQAAVQQAEANAASARANLIKANAEATRADQAFERAKALRKEGLIQQGDLETAESTATSARAQVDVAKSSLAQAGAALNLAQVNLSYTSILSPIDGVVISRNVDVGQTVAASLQAPVLFTIAEDLRKMQVDTSISEGDVGRLQQGMRATFTVDAFPGQKFLGKVDTIRNSPQTVQNVVTYDAVIKVDNDDLKLRPGMTANVTIVYAERDDTLAVPNTALRFRPPNAPADSASSRSRGGAGGAGAGGGNASAATAGPAGSASGGGRRGSWGGGAPRPDDTRTVWLLSGNAVSPVQVKIGLSDGTYTEIVEVTDGTLDVGATVATEASGGAVPTATATTVNPLGGGGGGGGGRRL